LSDFELIIVDDGSSDDSMRLIEELTPSFEDEVLILRHPNAENRGIVSTYELGLAHARGQYVAFLEQDDCWSPRFLEHKAAIFAKNPEVGVVFSPYQIVSEGWFGQDMTLRQWILSWSLPRNRPLDNFANLLRQNNIATFSSFTIRRTLIGQITAPSDRAMVYYDWWMLLQLSMHTKFFRDDQSICYWRQSRGSALGSQRWNTHRRRLVDFLKAINEYLDKNQCHLQSDQLAAYHSYRSTSHLAIAFAEEQSFSRFLQFFRRDPSWATRFLLSNIVNYQKFAGNDSRSQRKSFGAGYSRDRQDNLASGDSSSASSSERNLDNI
jgi:glycosyltransferase involved in cell wall biosynthesis